MIDVEDTGKMSDMVRVIVSVSDRAGRTHRYAYRNAMRYQCDEREDGNVYIAFMNDPRDRMHRAVGLNGDDSAAGELMKMLMDRDPRMLSGDPAACGNAAGALAAALGMILAGLRVKMDERAFDYVHATVLAKIDDNANKTLDRIAEYLEVYMNGGDPFRS